MDEWSREVGLLTRFDDFWEESKPFDEDAKTRNVLMVVRKRSTMTKPKRRRRVGAPPKRRVATAERNSKHRNVPGDPEIPMFTRLQIMSGTDQTGAKRQNL
jgi:hypothetical protein